MSRASAVDKNEDKAAYADRVADAVADVVRKQRELGIDIPDDGEFGKPVAGAYDYGAWWNYAFARMSGFSPAGGPEAAAHETLHKKIERRRCGADLVRQSPRLAEIQRVLSRSGIERQPDG